MESCRGHITDANVGKRFWSQYDIDLQFVLDVSQTADYEGYPVERTCRNFLRVASPCGHWRELWLCQGWLIQMREVAWWPILQRCNLGEVSVPDILYKDLRLPPRGPAPCV